MTGHAGAFFLAGDYVLAFCHRIRVAIASKKALRSLFAKNATEPMPESGMG